MDADHPNEIGPYRILEVLGEGAFGFVYLAEQTRPVRRKVALKVLKPGMDSRQILGRFEAERQAMAMMRLTPTSPRSWTLVSTTRAIPTSSWSTYPGNPITDYCDHYKLTVGERVKLIRQVSEAIQHAHQKGIIHRDLKSNNVLVARHEGRAVPKVIDFGIAKAMHQPLTEDVVHTVKGTLVGTPGYMSPEQVLGRSDIDTTTDIYALGVLLFELLVGVLPLEVQRLDMNALILAKTTKEPPTLSARLTELGERATTLAEDRGVGRGHAEAQAVQRPEVGGEPGVGEGPDAAVPVGFGARGRAGSLTCRTNRCWLAPRVRPTGSGSSCHGTNGLWEWRPCWLCC